MYVLSLSVNIFRTLRRSLLCCIHHTNIQCTTDSCARCKARQAGLFLLVDIYYTHDIGGSRRLMSSRIIHNSRSHDRDIACFYNTILL